MTQNTMVFGANVRRSEKWRLYQVRTANSTYELEVQSPSPGDTRPCCVLTCVAPASRAGQSFEDSSPRAGEDSLYAVSPLDWIGRCLTVGTARTSEVASVEFVSASDAPAPRKREAEGRGRGPGTMVFEAPATGAPKAEPRSASREVLQWAPFPLGYVQMAEAAASLLQVLANREDVLGQLKGDLLQRRRVEHALATCRLLLEALPEKV